MKKFKIIFWITTGFIFLLEAVMPMSMLIFAPEEFNTGTKPLGYPDYFAYALIISKFLGGTALIIPGISPRIKEWAYAGLAFSLIYAAISHIVVDGNVSYIMMPIVALIILLVSYYCYHKMRSIGKKGI